MFKYLLTINESKFPEVVKKLEKAKKREGIAMYIRHLVENDIAQSAPVTIPQSVTLNPVVIQPEIQMKKSDQPKPKRVAKVAAIDIDADFGGGLA